MTDQDEAEELLQQAGGQTRMTTEAESTESTASKTDLATAVADALEEIDSGSAYANMSIRDERLAALFEALDETGRQDDLIEATSSQLGTESDRSGKSGLLAMLVRVGLENVDEDVLDEAAEGYQQFLQREADDF